jgi:hypothetical protein
MKPHKDFVELVALFNANDVEFLIVGAYALAFYGVPRFTGDLDLYVHPAPENAQNVIKALDQFGFRSLGYQLDDFVSSERVVQLGVAPVRIDIMTSLSGVSWQLAWQNRKVGLFGELPVFFLGKEEFIANKRALGRPRDLADLDALKEGQ